ncbi:Hypp4300 [Branchiostoma lanceolatum]|uniref:Hypp4300 protein n=1 Tax=Branchiostoma lanceolatum TaxID=7740 RepID=A0A8K0A8L2_BRALA|nr:Hypp4300 [Branchiostoma lanceolatum]
MKRKRKRSSSSSDVMSISYVSTMNSRLCDNNSKLEDYERRWHDDFFRGWKRLSNRSCESRSDARHIKDDVATKMCSFGFKIGSLHGHNDLEEVNNKMEEYTKEWVEGLGTPSRN